MVLRIRDISVSCVASYVKNYFCSAWHYSRLYLSQMDYSSVQGFSREENIQGPDLKALFQVLQSAPEKSGQFFFCSKPVMCLLSVPRGSQQMFAKGVCRCGFKKK